jgi:hypothetical protein
LKHGKNYTLVCGAPSRERAVELVPSWPPATVFHVWDKSHPAAAQRAAARRQQRVEDDKVDAAYEAHLAHIAGTDGDERALAAWWEANKAELKAEFAPAPTAAPPAPPFAPEAQDGKLLIVRTLNSLYRVAVLKRTGDDVTVLCAGPHDIAGKLVRLSVGRGMYVEEPDGRYLHTSEVRSIEVRKQPFAQ